MDSHEGAIMSKTMNAQAKKSFTKAKASRTSKTQWHVFGLGQENKRDPAALTFARLGLLATRW